MEPRTINLGKVAPTVEGEWDITKDYTRISIVYVEDSNGNIRSYISRKAVPHNLSIDITNKEYWSPFALTIYDGPEPGPGPSPQPTDIFAYSGFVSNISEIELVTSLRTVISNNVFNTNAGANTIMWFAIPSDKTIVTVENNNFQGDFIQDDLEEGSIVTVDDVDYKIYFYDVGLIFDNTYKVTIN